MSEGIAERHSAIELLLTLGRDAPYSKDWGVIAATGPPPPTRLSADAMSVTPRNRPFDPTTLPRRRPRRLSRVVVVNHELHVRERKAVRC